VIMMPAAAPMDTREGSELSLTAIEEREDPHTQGPFGEPRTADDDRSNSEGQQAAEESTAPRG
jgi:hypothetical protein